MADDDEEDGEMNWTAVMLSQTVNDNMMISSMISKEK